MTREPLATTAEVAAYLGRKPQTVRWWRATGQGPNYTGQGHGVRYRWADVDAWLNQQTTKTAS
jgi:hypothetical protein